MQFAVKLDTRLARRLIAGPQMVDVTQEVRVVWREKGKSDRCSASEDRAGPVHGSLHISRLSANGYPCEASALLQRIDGRDMYTSRSSAYNEVNAVKRFECVVSSIRPSREEFVSNQPCMTLSEHSSLSLVKTKVFVMPQSCIR